MTAAFAMLLLLFGQPAAAQQVRFTGATTADPVLIRDALQQLLRHAAASHGCTSLTEVRATVLPDDYAPSDPRYRVAAAAVRYERWDATLCHRPAAYLIGFWASPQGGTMFQVSHPFPDERATSQP